MDGPAAGDVGISGWLPVDPSARHRRSEVLRWELQVDNFALTYARALLTSLLCPRLVLCQRSHFLPVQQVISHFSMRLMTSSLKKQRIREPHYVAGDDARECARITRAHARTFSLASKMLPAEKRRASYALYAFCRVADDLVDNVRPARSVSLSAKPDSTSRDALRDYSRQFKDALAGRPSGPVFREVAWVIDRYKVPADPLFELLSGVARDLEISRYQSWSALERYCEGVASSVGEMCTHVFGVANPESLSTAVRHARTLGIAMQLTNILRDVGEDARRGRCYLPADDLSRFGFSPDDVIDNGASLVTKPQWKELMKIEVARARALYQSSLVGIALLSPDSQRCAAACSVGYGGILNAIEMQDYDTISSRASLGNVARASVLWQAWRYKPGSDRFIPNHETTVESVNDAPTRESVARLA